MGLIIQECITCYIEIQIGFLWSIPSRLLELSWMMLNRNGWTVAMIFHIHIWMNHPCEPVCRAHEVAMRCLPRALPNPWVCTNSIDAHPCKPKGCFWMCPDSSHRLTWTSVNLHGHPWAVQGPRPMPHGPMSSMGSCECFNFEARTCLANARAII